VIPENYRGPIVYVIGKKGTFIPKLNSTYRIEVPPSGFVCLSNKDIFFDKHVTRSVSTQGEGYPIRLSSGDYLRVEGGGIMKRSDWTDSHGEMINVIYEFVGTPSEIKGFQSAEKIESMLNIEMLNKCVDGSTLSNEIM